MRDKLDAVGLGLSGLCVAHCLLVPLLVILIPALSTSFIESEWAHIILVGFALPVSLFAFWHGLGCHKCFYPGLIGIVGLALMTVVFLVPVEELAETLLTLAGATLLAIGHLYNQRLLSAGGPSGPQEA